MAILASPNARSGPEQNSRAQDQANHDDLYPRIPHWPALISPSLSNTPLQEDS
mgnify:CR=1 FL=1